MSHERLNLPVLQALVAHAATEVLGGGFQRWRYARRSERWQLVAAAVRLIRLALALPSPPNKDAPHGEASAVTTRSKVACIPVCLSTSSCTRHLTVSQAYVQPILGDCK